MDGNPWALAFAGLASVPSTNARTRGLGSTNTHARRPIRFCSLALCCETRKTCRTRPVGRLLGVGHPRAQLRSRIRQLDAMFNTPSQEPAVPGHLPDLRPA